MGYLAWIVVGAVAGFLASVIMGSREGLVMMVVLGVVGGLLGGFLLALWARKATQADAMIGIATSAVFMFVLWLGSKGFVPFPLGKAIAWPWYSLLGSTIAFFDSTCDARRRRRVRARLPGHRPRARRPGRARCSRRSS